MSIYGFWIGAQGCIEEQTGYIVCTTQNESDMEWLLQTLPLAGLSLSEFTIAAAGSQVVITAPRWCQYFAEQQHGAMESGLFSWVLHECDKSQLRLLLSGMHRAAGLDEIASESKSISTSIVTSSTHLRDALLVIAMHAGYSAYFVSHDVSGAWRVCYDEADTDAAAPTLVRSKDITVTTMESRIWCVTVDHPDHLLLAQRATRTPSSSILPSSSSSFTPSSVGRPLVVGNCWHTSPEQRPPFEKIVERLSNILAAIPVDDNSAAGIVATSTPTRPADFHTVAGDVNSPSQQ